MDHTRVDSVQTKNEAGGGQSISHDIIHIFKGGDLSHEDHFHVVFSHCEAVVCESDGVDGLGQVVGDEGVGAAIVLKLKDRHFLGRRNEVVIRILFAREVVHLALLVGDGVAECDFLGTKVGPSTASAIVVLDVEDNSDA